LALEVSILMKGCPFVTCVNTRKEKVLRLVELAGVLSDPTGWKFASGVFLRGFMRGCGALTS